MPTVGGSISLSRFFALKSSQRSSDRIRVELFRAYTFTNWTQKTKVKFGDKVIKLREDGQFL